ncbi:MAG: phage major tail tube protein [Sulfurovum sp.]|nr:phage major tail tube protein [Sulfurovum sp.]
MKPAFITYFNLFVEGVGFIGKVEDYKEPDVKTMKGETPMGYKVDLGIPEALEAEVSLSTVNKVLYDAMVAQDAAKFVIKEEVVEDGERKTIIHTMTGPFEAERDSGKLKEGKKIKLKLYPQRYAKEVAGTEEVFVDLVAPILRLNGKDIVEDTRNAVS